MKPRIRYKVELEYETMSGNKAVRVYAVAATNDKSAINYAQIRIERLKDFKKTISATAVEV